MDRLLQVQYGFSHYLNLVNQLQSLSMPRRVKKPDWTRLSVYKQVYM